MAHIAVDDLVVLCVLDDLENLLDGTVDIAARATKRNDVLAGGIIRLCAKLDGESLVFADDTAECSECENIGH